MDFPSLLDRLLKNYGLPEAPPQDDVAYTLSFADEAKVHFIHHANAPEVRVYAYLFPSLEGFEEVMSRKLMEENAFGSVSANAACSLDREKKMFVLSENFDLATLTEELFMRHLSQFLGAMRELQKNYPRWQVEAVVGSRGETEEESDDVGMIKV